ncbi:MAG: hypothetical protein ACOZNI_12665 [Myxococcota bacterium]
MCSRLVVVAVMGCAPAAVEVEGDTDTGGRSGRGTSPPEVIAVSNEPRCADLAFEAVVEAWGEACGTCDLGRPLVLIGRVRNPCDAPQRVVSSGSCLVTRWEIVDTATGDLAAYEAECTPDLTRWEVPASGAIDVPYAWGTLPTGDYTLRVVFDPAVSPPVERSFRVRELGY